MQNIDCLKYLIGLSRENCGCFGQTPETATRSDCGIYIDELNGLSKILKALCRLKNCPEKDVWELLDKARCNAAQMLLGDVSRCLMQGRQPNTKVELRSLRIGGEIDGRFKKASGKYVVNRIDLDCEEKDIVFCINKVGLLPFKVDGKLQSVKKFVTIYDSMGEPLCVEPICIETALSTNKNKAVSWFTFSNALEFNAYEAGMNCLYFVFELLPNEQVNDNKTWCGCKKKKAPKWAKYLRSHSFIENDIGENSGCEIEFFGDKFKHDNCCDKSKQNMLGLALDVSFICDINGIICDKASGKSSDKLSLGQALAYKTAVNAIDYILCSETINYESIAKKEKWWGLQNKFDRMYREVVYGYTVGETHVAGICELINVDDSACFCKKKNGPTMSLYRGGGR